MLREQYLLPRRLLLLFHQLAYDGFRVVVTGKNTKICNREYNMEVIVADKGKGSFIPRAIPLRNRSSILANSNPTLVAEGLLNATSCSKEVSYVSGRKKRRVHLWADLGVNIFSQTADSARTYRTKTITLGISHAKCPHRHFCLRMGSSN